MPLTQIGEGKQGTHGHVDQHKNEWNPKIVQVKIWISSDFVASFIKKE